MNLYSDDLPYPYLSIFKYAFRIVLLSEPSHQDTTENDVKLIAFERLITCKISSFHSGTRQYLSSFIQVSL